MNGASFGPLIKAKESLAVFARHPPSPRELLANRTQRFDRIHGILPSSASPGASLSLTVQVWDQCERLHSDFEGTVRVDATDPEAEFPTTIAFDSDQEGIRRVAGVEFETPGIQYLTLTREETDERFVSNPVRVAAAHDHRVYWGDVHLHSTLSDGSGSAATGYDFGREVMDLDVVAYTDHDTMGFFIPPNWQRARMQGGYFETLTDLADDRNDPGEFVTLPAYEWTKQPNTGGHVNVYFEDSADATLFDSLAADTTTYEQLWSRLREWDRTHESGVVTIPHHPAEAMFPFDFAAMDYDDELAPLVEVYSQWGSSELPAGEANPFPLAMGQGEVGTPGHYVQDAHRLGYKVGMMASADFHGPRPGHSIIHARPHFPSLTEWRGDGLGWGNIWRVWNEQSYPGGLTAFLAPELTRPAVFSALKTRSVYGTTQPHRILVDFRINGVDVAAQDGAVSIESPDAAREISVSVAGTAALDTVTVVKNNDPWRRYEGPAAPTGDVDDFTLDRQWTDDEPVTGMAWDDLRGSDGDVYTVRVRQHSRDRYPGMAWVGPIWVEPDTE